MIELYSMLWISALFFGILGAQRGWNKELISLAGVLVAMVAMYQLDTLVRGWLLASLPRDQAFFLQLIAFITIVYFAYQTRGGSSRNKSYDGRWQDWVLGGLMGAFNGYMIWGMIWYFLDINEYPLAPLILAPAPSSISAQNIGIIPLLIFNGVVGGNGDFLAALVILLFVGVLFVI